VRYRIVEAADYILLEELITVMMSKDWRPTGGVAIGVDGRFYQAMWKQT